MGELEGKQFQCVLRNSQVCSLGATSLTIIGILDLLEKYPELETTYEKQLSELVNFLLVMKKPNEGYKGYYRYHGPPSEKESDFSNGEAVLALIRYYAFSQNEEVKKVIDEVGKKMAADPGIEVVDVLLRPEVPSVRC